MDRPRQNVPPFPLRYRVFRRAVPHVVPGFASDNERSIDAFSPSGMDSQTWYYDFVERIIGSIGQTHTPVVRLGDGEYRLWLGESLPSPRRHGYSRARGYIRYLMDTFSRRFHPHTVGRYSSGYYTRSEMREARRLYDEFIVQTLSHGVLAPAIHYTNSPSIYEAHFAKLRRKFDEIDVAITEHNLVPVYFVYAFLSSPASKPLFADRRILVVTNADDRKKARISRCLKTKGALSVDFVDLSSQRSLFDRVTLRGDQLSNQVCFVGAGVGKANVFCQLRGIQGPCIDAGFIIEAWADSTAVGERPYTKPS